MYRLASIRLTRKDSRGIEQEICWRCHKILLKDAVTYCRLPRDEKNVSQIRQQFTERTFDALSKSGDIYTETQHFWRCLNGWCPESARVYGKTLREHLIWIQVWRELAEEYAARKQLETSIGEWFTCQQNE